MLFQYRTIPRSCLTPLQLLIHLAVAGGYFTVPLVTLVFWEIRKWFGLLTMLVLFTCPATFLAARLLAHVLVTSLVFLETPR